MKDSEEWLKLLSDEARADVMKVQIAESEATKRKAIEESEATKRSNIATEGYHVVRGLFVLMLVCAVAGATCLGYHNIIAQHPSSVPTISDVSDAGRAD